MAKKLGTGRRRPGATIPTAPAREASPGDNIRAAEEAERIQLISFINKLDKAEEKIELAKGPYDAAKQEKRAIESLATAAGFSKTELKKRREEMRLGTRENAEQIAREARQRRWLGIIEPDQAALLLGDQAPQEAKDEAHFKGEGYKAGLRQLAAKPPPEVPERFVQAWMAEHARGFKESTEANAPRALAAQAAKDFKEDNPEVDLDAAARKLKNDPGFMDRSAPDDKPCGECGCVGMHTDECSIGQAHREAGSETAIEAGGEAPPVIVGGTDPDAPFEATEEELAGQSPRRAVQEARGETEDVV